MTPCDLPAPSPETPPGDPGRPSGVVGPPQAASVVPIRRDGPIEHARRFAVASAPEFIDGSWPTWSWPWRLARRLMSVDGVGQAADPMALRIPILAFYEATGIAAALENHYPTAHDFFVAVVAEWFSVRFPEGEGPLEAASRQAASVPVRIAGGLSPNFCKLVATAAHLQESVGPSAIILPTRLVGRLLNITPQHAGQLLRVAVRLGYLEPIETTWSYTEHRARTFRYIGPAPSQG